MDKIIIVDVTSSKLDAFKNEGFNILNESVIDIQAKEWMGNIQFNKPSYFVSPANSKGYMDCGVDAAYMRMFPGIQDRVQESIKKLNILNKMGVPYLPIGSATIVPADEKYFMIAAPTMLHPQPIIHTMNPYWAMKAILKVWPENGMLIIPPLGCGYGLVKPEDAARMMKQAVNEHVFTGPRKTIENYIINSDEIMKQQPKFYENTEYFDIPPQEITKDRHF
jgi:O-acetyl-ADP-ribose deacetylase (regulator of RNase III)